METDLFWYCLRSQPKHEHIAAAHLALMRDVEVYCPRLRIQRITRRGPGWFTEALFPGYLFCRFDRAQSQKAVTYAQGVSGIVRFGSNPAIVPNGVIAELRSLVGTNSVQTIPVPEIRQGDTVTITRGPFLGLKTLVTQASPASERIRILLDLLGNCHEAVIARSNVFKETPRLLCT
jgi:transcriptional antiterminator RfaH